MRYLIVGSNEKTWKFNRPIVFLGEWCRNFDRRYVWKSMDAIVAEPYGLGQAKRDADHLKARALEAKLFKALCLHLNEHHGTDHGERFWRIVLGHWLRSFVNVLLNRVNTLEQCYEKYNISGTTLYTENSYELAARDSLEAEWAFDDDRWNVELTSRILKLLKWENFEIERIPADQSLGFHFNATEVKPNFKRRFFKWCYTTIINFMQNFAKDTDAFITRSYLPFNEEIKLHFALGQCPQLRFRPNLEIKEKYDREIRNKLSENISIISSDNLERILFSLIFELIPICYLEGFVNLIQTVRRQNWPKHPKFIFTSNSFFGDEVFKLWTALKVESGVKYYTGQHGNHYGTHRYFNPSVEELTSDKFLTWGWRDGLIQHTPAFIFKTAGRPEKNYDKKGGLLLIEVCRESRRETFDVCHDFCNFFEDQKKFISQLSVNPRDNLTVRLYSTLRSQELERWDVFDAKIKLENGKLPISEQIAKSRLVVHSYDSTGILETLSQNIPTIAFWQNGFDHLRESAIPYYKLLVDAEIVHLSPESAANKINEIWDDIDAWWNGINTQKARASFCERFAHMPAKPLDALLELLDGN